MLAEMFGYATDFRSKPQGMATFTVNFLNYTAISEDLVKRIIEEMYSKKC